MAFTEHEVKVLGALSLLEPIHTMTVRQLGTTTGLSESSIRRALMRLGRSGLVLSTPQGPARWRSTERGRRALTQPAYHGYLEARS
ncbi:hypothetical protein ABZ319_00550 [Nocardia sp. NPDC005978]|uniref:hypothetical protein n=1 Tax=Nocardia sp. NPDC005978 TaxID=3156725 RepID=UPI0033B1AFD6